MWRTIVVVPETAAKTTFDKVLCARSPPPPLVSLFDFSTKDRCQSFSCRAPGLGEKTHETDAGRCVSAFQQNLVPTHLVSTEASSRCGKYLWSYLAGPGAPRDTREHPFACRLAARAGPSSFLRALPPSFTFSPPNTVFPTETHNSDRKKTIALLFFPLQSQNGE